MRDDLEQAYHNATGSCLEAMIAMHCFCWKEAIDELNRANRFIEDGQRKAEAKLRRDMRSTRAYITSPPPIS